jgi:uncharacterized protein
MGVDAVKLRVDDITAEAREISFAEPEQEINRIVSQGPVREYQVAAPVDVALSYYRAGTDLFISGEVAVQTTASCARCTEDFPATRRRPFRYVLAPKVIGYDNDSDLRADDIEFTLYEGDEVDLTPLIREQLLLALADRPLCREDCRGLCARCGENLNQRECGCQSDRFDPRMAVLRSLKAGRS